jgi:hypothetical protein
MTILIQHNGLIYFSAGSLARLAISGEGVVDPLDVALADIKELQQDADGNLIVNGTKYPHCGKACADIRLAAKAQGILL